MEETRVRFVIPASEAESMAQKANLPSVLHLLPSLVPSAQRLARTPISNFHVGAVGIGGVSGRVFLGVNVEFLNLPLNYSIHAEQFLLTNLSLNAEPSLSHFAVSAAPCGHCRQFYQELRNASSLNILVADSDLPTATAFTPLSHFLPHRFGPENLLSKHLPFLLEPHHNGLSFLTNSQPNGFTTTAAAAATNKLDSLCYAALDAANKSHAPYSGCPSGVALIDTDGNIHKGSYAESAAYNPSIGPAQAALVAYIANGGGHGYEKIVAAVLVEMESAIVKQEHAARLLFQTISPKCEFKVFLCVGLGGTKRPSSI